MVRYGLILTLVLINRFNCCSCSLKHAFRNLSADVNIIRDDSRRFTPISYEPNDFCPLMSSDSDSK